MISLVNNAKKNLNGKAPVITTIGELIGLKSKRGLDQDGNLDQAKPAIGAG